MVFGENLLENAFLLAGMVDHVEIVLFYTPALHNFLSPIEIKALRKLGAKEDVSFSVQLPSSLEIASRVWKKQEKSVLLAIDLIKLMDEVNSLYHILHIPHTKPTLTPVPGMYLPAEHRDKFIDWTKRTMESLETIQGRVAKSWLKILTILQFFLKTFGSLDYAGSVLIWDS